MTQESEGDRSQKTVAELLAQHGASTGSRRKRHRRAAEDEEGEEGEAPAAGRGISDTAPQAIIDRIQGEGSDGGNQHGGSEQETGQNGTNGTAVSPRDDPANGRHPAQPAAAAKPPPHPPKPPHQQSGPMPRPPSPGRQPQQQEPQHQEPQHQEPRQQDSPADRAGSGPVAARLDGAQAPPARPTEQGPEAVAPSREDTRSEQGGSAPPPAAPQRGRGGLPWSPNGRRMPLRPARRGEPEPNTDQFPAVEQPQDGSGADVPAAAPPAGLARWRQRRRRSEGAAEQTDVGAVPPVPAKADEQASAPSAAPDQHAGPATGTFTPSFDTGTQSVFDDYVDEDYYDDQAPERYEDYPDFDDDGYDSSDSQMSPDDVYEDDEFRDEDFDDLEYVDEDDDFDESDAGSPARQWLVLAGQLALGVVAGAGVWLGFNWLWGQMPSAALVAALLATLGLVWVVRKVRRAEDTQTTVLALLVGLVVSVSPAALLLVSR